MSKTIAQIYSLTNLADALMCVELGADHIGVAFGDVDHLGPIQKTCAEAKYIFDNLPDNVVKIGLTIAKDVDEILANPNAPWPWATAPGSTLPAKSWTGPGSSPF